MVATYGSATAWHIKRSGEEGVEQIRKEKQLKPLFPCSMEDCGASHHLLCAAPIPSDRMLAGLCTYKRRCVKGSVLVVELLLCMQKIFLIRHFQVQLGKKCGVPMPANATSYQYLQLAPKAERPCSGVGDVREK